MAHAHQDASTIISTRAADRFVETYYRSLNAYRSDIATYYAPAATMPNGQMTPVIIWNGNIVPDPASYQRMFVEEMPQSHYNTQSFDCHVINHQYNPETSATRQTEASKNISILVTVSGKVVYGDYNEGETQGFSENFVLVPNSESSSGDRKAKEWLIQSQNFRLV